MAQAGTAKAFNGGTAVAGNGFSSYAVRFRAADSTSGGFIFENGSNERLLSIRGNDGFASFSGAVTGASFSGSGSGLTSLDASNISSGTLDSARLPSSISIGGDITSRDVYAAFKTYTVGDTSLQYIGNFDVQDCVALRITSVGNSRYGGTFVKITKAWASGRRPEVSVHSGESTVRFLFYYVPTANESYDLFFSQSVVNGTSTYTMYISSRTYTNPTPSATGNSVIAIYQLYARTGMVGMVGIGTTNPLHDLHVGGTGFFSRERSRPLHLVEAGAV